MWAPRSGFTEQVARVFAAQEGLGIEDELSAGITKQVRIEAGPVGA
jgi:hypothetical protein